MAKIKWDPAATPLNNEHDGYTFQRNNYGFSMFPAGRNARKRYERQWLRQHPNQKAVTQWRNMPQSVKDLWTLFASTFPQPAQKDPDQFLNGFECFVKRNYFCFLNHGIHSDFMLEPDLVVNEGEPITFRIKAETTAIECAELYIKNFGLLPQVGDKLLVYAAVYSEFTGHFYESINTYAIVEEIYIDSFQIAVYIPDTFNDVSVSVYLSKPVSHGQSYVGTKIRYMGCFTTKKIVQLQDVNITNITNEGNVLIFEGDTEEVTNITYGDLIEIIKKTDCGTIVYDENTEWTAGPTGSYFNFENEEEVFNKTKSIQVLNCPSNSAIGFESGAEIATDTYAAVVLYIKLMAEMPSNLDIKLLFIYEDEHHSNQIALSINKTLLDEWQPLLVPLSLFTFDGPTFTGIQLFLTIDTGSAIFPEMYIDYIALMETEAEPDCTCFCKPIPEVDYPLPEPVPGEAGQPVVVNPDGDGYEPGNFPAPTNAFNPVNVDGKTPVTADNPAEPVEFVAGDNITIETSNGPKRIIFAAAGGGSFDCADLLECDIIQNIIETISTENNTSIPKIDFGLFYTFAVISDPRGLAKAGWHVPTREEWETLQTNLGGYDVAGGKLKDTATEYWLQPNVGATNEAKFNARGGGSVNYSDGNWQVQYQNWVIWSSTEVSIFGRIATLSYSHTNFVVGSTSRMTKGHNIRLLKNLSSLAHGENGVYIGNNGRAYRTINIHGQEFLADNLHETIFNNGESIPQMASEAEWAAASGAKCASFQYS